MKKLAILTITDVRLTRPSSEFKQEDLKKIEQYFHELLLQTAKDYKVEKHRDDWEEMPRITNDLAKEEKPRFFTIPGMYGGFAYILYERDNKPVLMTNSWCRIWGGSGQEHEITVDGTKLVSQGFI